MNKLYLFYEAPKATAIDLEPMSLLCESITGPKTEDFTDGEWSWEN